MLYQRYGLTALQRNSPKCILLLTIKEERHSLLSPAVSGCKKVWHKGAACLLLLEGVELPNSVHISLEKVLVLG